jgi:hypothetical protein
VHTAAVSSLAGGAGGVAPLQLEDYDTVRQAVELDNARIWEVLVLPPVLKIVGALVVLAVGVLIELYWRAREAVDGKLVIPFLDFQRSFAHRLIAFRLLKSRKTSISLMRTQLLKRSTRYVELLFNVHSLMYIFLC